MTVEISLYPLSESYEEVVLGFLDRFAAESGLPFRTNGMSTQVFGDSSEVFPALQRAFENVQDDAKSMLVLKMGPGTLRYEGKHS